MDVNLVRRWINDLRYGGHVQARGGLHIEDGYCCLGRAIEVIHGEGKWVLHTNDIFHIKDLDEAGLCYYAYPYDDPKMIADDDCWVGLSPEDIETLGLIEIGAYPEKLVDMNDDGLTFKEIADYIEGKLETYLANNGEDANGQEPGTALD